MTKKEATDKTNDLVAKLEGNWVPSIWDNLGWCFCVESADGHISVWERHSDVVTYNCLLSSGDYKHSGSGLWHDGDSYADPNDAVNATIDQARTITTKLIDHIDNVIEGISI